MNTKKVLAILGVILIIIQAVSYFGMSRMYVGLYPDALDMIQSPYVPDSDLNVKKAMFAINAGFDRFMSGFGDLTYPLDEYRVMTAEQITSVMIRESLNCRSGGSSGLAIYDTILTVSYYFTGIVGVALLIGSAKVKEQAASETESEDET